MKEPIYVADSSIKGKGIFATRNIKKKEIICKFKGERLKAEDLRVSMKGRDIMIDPLQVGRNDYFNLAKPYVFINHSCDPNAGIVGENLIAIKNIKKDEELTYDYSSTWVEGFDCRCGRKICRGFIGDFTGIPKHIMRKYKKLMIVPDYIKIS